MKYTEEGDTVSLEMSRSEYAKLVLAIAIAADSDPDPKVAWIEFLNRLNAGNTGFMPFEVPERFNHLSWQKRHEEMGCTHPPGCVSCTWCGFGILP